MMLPVNSLVYDVLPAQMDNTGFLSRGSSCGTPDDTPGALGLAHEEASSQAVRCGVLRDEMSFEIGRKLVLKTLDNTIYSVLYCI